MTNDKKFIEWLELRELSPITIKDYMFYFSKLNFENLKNQEYLNGFFRRYNNLVCKAFINNLFEYRMEIKDPINLVVPKIKGRKKRKIPDIITKEEVHMIVNSIDSKRDKVMVLVTYYCGLRIGELVKIRPFSFNWKQWKEEESSMGRLSVIGKGNKQRIIPVIPTLMATVHDWIKTIENNQYKINPLFKIGERRFQTILSKASKKAIGRHINPHLLRHSVSTYLKQSGMDLQEIAEFLGHDSIVTTQIYSHIDKEALGKKVNELLS